MYMTFGRNDSNFCRTFFGDYMLKRVEGWAVQEHVAGCVKRSGIPEGNMSRRSGEEG